MKKMLGLALLLVAAGATPVLFLQGCSQNSASSVEAKQTCEMCAKGVPHKHYTCPMCGGDKAVADGTQPGKCAGCKMDMVEKKK